MITRQSIKKISSTCGVYIFYSKNVPIYIGKAINLKARLYSHLQASLVDNKERQIITKADKLVIKKTLSDFNSTLLEAELIRKYKPKYNVVWKDDKSFLYIKVTIGDTYPKVHICRSENNKNNLYYGPFKSSSTTKSITKVLRTIIPFCTQKKTSGNGCFYSKIGLCNPCPNIIEKTKDPQLKHQLQSIYLDNINLLISILSGKSKTPVAQLKKKLKKYSRDLQYEEATKIRDALINLEKLHQRQISQQHDRDANFEKKFITQLGLFVYENFDISFSKKSKQYILECFDISTLFNTSSTASCVSFINTQSDKSKYRRYKIATQKKGDTNMMREVLTRRFKDKYKPYPDLLMIDGGITQLKTAVDVLQKLKITIPVISMVKNPDRIMVGKPPYKTRYFESDNPFFTVLRALRDESHRFANNYHRLLRKRKLLL